MSRSFPRAQLLRRAALFASLSALAGSSCVCVTPPVPPGEICGNGSVTKGGTAADYTIDATRSRLILVVEKADGAGCGIFHSHVINATQALFDFNLDDGDLATGEITVTVPVPGLDPDAPELRTEFLPENDSEPLDDGTRNSIRGSILEETIGNEYPVLTFKLKNLSSLDSGEAELESDIAGAVSTVPLTYTVTEEGDAVLVTGEAVLEGAPHGMPRQALGACVNPAMPVFVEVAFVPGETACDGQDDPVPPYEPTVFPDDGCAESVGYNDARDVLGPRCMGCHLDNLRGGATVPLVSIDDYRVDSLRHPAVPLYETGHEFWNLPANAQLAMPTLDATGLQPGELEVINTWVEEGAHGARCENDPGPTTFDRIAHVDCGDLNFTTPGADPDGEGPIEPQTAESFLQRNCVFCHSEGNPGAFIFAPKFASYDELAGVDTVDIEAGFAAGEHPYYADDSGVPLSIWEQSLHRSKDFSMPIGYSQEFLDTDAEYRAGLAQFEAWVNAGFPAAACE